MKSLLIPFLLASTFVLAQGGRGGPPQPPKAGREAAPVDLTGNWVSVVTEDYRWRMVTPLKGDAAGIPYRSSSRALIDSWDPAKDEAAGMQCKSYGAPALMRVPGRLRVTWQDENTLKIEADAGTQTRLLHFQTGNSLATAPVGSEKSWQGFSAARWEVPTRAASGGIPGFILGGGERVGTTSRTLHVITGNLRDGYLRKNGIPYSEQTKLTEYFDRFSEPNGDEWFTVTTIVEDPVHLAGAYITTTDFKKERDGSKFAAAACSAR